MMSNTTNYDYKSLHNNLIVTIINIRKDKIILIWKCFNEE